MILIAEPVHFGDTHVQVNSAFLSLIQYNFSDQKICVVAEHYHCESIRSNANQSFEDVEFFQFHQYSQKGRFYWFQKVLGEWKQILKVCSIARRQRPELLVWLCLFPTGHLLLQILNLLSFSKQKQLIILHGEMEYLGNANKLSEIFLKWCMKIAFKTANHRTSFIVLGESIKRNLTSFSFLQHDRIFSFHHPFLYHSKMVNKEVGATLKFCTFGTLKKSKNAHLFFELALRFSKEISDGLIRFNTIGKIFDDVKPFQNSFVNPYKPDCFLAQMEYESKIAEQDVALFFYDKSMYQLSASGAFHEALNNRLPIISLQNDYFMNASNSNIAIKCVPSLDEMEDYIRILINDEKEKITDQYSSLATFIQQNSFLLQSQRLKIILQKLSL